jgi:hypothetical protein
MQGQLISHAESNLLLEVSLSLLRHDTHYLTYRKYSRGYIYLLNMLRTLIKDY